MRVLVLVAAAALLAACETMTPQECAVADWRAIGYQDGAAGYGLDRFGERQQICANAGYPADFDAYRLAREEGLSAYCRPDRAFRNGLEGGSYRGVCPAELDADYRYAFDQGARAYRAKSALSSAESALSGLRRERDDLDRKISANEEGLLRSATDAERQRHRDELIRLRAERARIDDDIDRRERDMRSALDDLTRLRADIGFRWGSW